MERRLAAVMIADVAGYGRLSQADEEGTRARFQADLNEVFEPTIARHHGRLAKTMGDGLLVEFHSVVDALRCAVEVQRAEGERNAGLPAGRQMQFRIGINLGDVIVEGDDIHGDGVIIAERLQQLADTGGIVISGTAYDQAKGKVAVGFACLGKLPVKNIAEPVRVYRALMDPKDAGNTIDERIAPASSRRWPAAAAAAVVLLIAFGGALWWRPWEPAIEPASIERMVLPLPDKPSIAVLPFANMSDDPKQDYFADGITDDLITELSQVTGLFVISRNSTFVYKGKTVPPKQVSEELGVRYVLEGSVQRSGNQLRINAQLIDTLDGGHAWADRFNGSLADVFALQDKVTNSIADALAIRLSASEQHATEETKVPAAYDAFLRGWEHFRRTTAEDYAKAIPYFEEAIRLDPDYSRAHAALTLLYGRASARGHIYAMGLSYQDAKDRAKMHLAKAQEHPTAFSHQAAGFLYIVDSGQPERAVTEFKDAIAGDPGNSWNYAFMGWALVGAGRPAEAVSHIRTAIRLDPHYPSSFAYWLAMAQFAMEQYPDAAESLEDAARLNPDDEFAFELLAATYGHLKRTADAETALARCNGIRVGLGDTPLALDRISYLGFFQLVDRARLTNGLRRAGVPESLTSDEFAKQNRLSADEVRMLVYGRRLHGRTPWTGRENIAFITSEGVLTSSGDWGYWRDTKTAFRADEFCMVHGDNVADCVTLLRNPGGTKARENEYIWVDGHGAYPFSQVE